MAGYNPLENLTTVDQALSMYQPAAPPPEGTPTGTGNLLTSALGSGAYSALGSLGSGAEALTRAAGFDDAANAAAAFAARQRATAATYARPDLENASYFSPSGFAYKTLQGLPLMAGIAGGAVAGEAAAPILGIGAGAAALGGGALAAFLPSAGQNIDRAREEGQQVDQGTALKALALGVPLAAVQAALPAMGEGMIAGRIGGMAPKLFGSEIAGKAAVGAASGAAVQVPAAAAGEAIMQQMGDPNRSFAERSHAIVTAALEGGAQGAVFGGVLHSFAKKPPSTITNDELGSSVDAATNPQLPAPEGMQPTLQLTDQTPPIMPGRQPASGEVIVPPAELGQTPARKFDASNVNIGPESARVAPAAGERGEIAATPQLASVPPAEGERGLPPLDRANIPPAQGELGTVVTPEIAGVPKMPPTLNRPTPVTPEIAGVPPAEGERGTVVQPSPAERANIPTFEGERAPPPIERANIPPLDETQRAALAEQQTQDIKKATRGFLPDFLKPHLGDTVALKGAIFDKVQERLAAQKAPYKPSDLPDILGSRLNKIAKSFGVLDDQGKLTDPRVAQEQNDTARAQTEADQAETTNLGPNPDVPSRVMRDAISETHQPKWDALEALRKDAPQEFLAKIDDLQSRLASPKRGEVGQIVKQTSDLRKAVEGQKAVDAVRAPEAKPAPEAAPKPVADETQGAKKFSEPVSAAKPPEEPTPAVSKQDQLKAKQRGKTDAVQERSTAPLDAREQPQAGGGVREGNTERQAPAAEVKAPARAENSGQAVKAEIKPEKAQAVSKALKAVRDNIGELMNQKLPERVRTVKGEKIAESPAGYAKRAKAYDAAMSGLGRAQGEIVKALKSGDPRELAKIKAEHFPSTAYDEFYDDMTPKGQKLLDEHAQKVDELLSRVNDAAGLHPRYGDAFASHPPTPHDEAVGTLIDRGASAREILQHIARNGSNSIRRTMAAKLLQMSKADPSIRFGTMDEMANDHPTQRNVYGDYHSGTDAVRIFDKSDSEHTVLHEFAHAATVRAIENDPAVRAKADALHTLAKAQMTPEEAAHPSMNNSAEMVAEAMANPDFASLLDTMNGPGKQTLWQSIKDFVRQVFGLPKGSESLLDHVESLAGEAADVTNNLNTVAGIERTTGLYARWMQDTAQKLGGKLDRTLDLHGVDPTMFRKSLFWRKAEGIAASIGHYLTSAMMYVKNSADLKNYKESFHGITVVAHNAERALDRAQRFMLNDLRLATAKGIDPRVSPDKHTWLIAEERKALTPEIKRLNDLWNQANRGDKKVALAYELQNNANRVNEMSAQVAQGLRTIQRSGVKIDLTENPMEKFNRDTNGIKDDPRKAEAFWSGEFKTMRDAVREALGHVDDAIRQTADPEQVRELRAKVEDLRSWDRGAARSVASLSQAPNFPVRRYGSQHVSFDLPDNFGQKEATQLQNMLSAKGHDGYIDHNIKNSSAYMRADNVSALNSMIEVLKEAQAKGLIKGIKSYGPAASLAKEPGVLPSHLTAEIKAFREAFPKMDESGPDGDRASAYNQAVDRQLNELQQSLIDMLPENNTSKIFARRENVQGMSTEMGKAFLERSSNTATAVAQTFMSDRMNATRNALRDEVEKIMRDDTVSPALKDKIHAAANEFMLRDAQKQWRTEPTLFDAARRWTHFFELSLSVPYALTLHTQSWTLGVGELTKHFGAVNSTREMAKAQAKALKVMSATFSTGEGLKGLMKDLIKPGSDRWASILTRDKLEKSGLSKQEIEDVLTLNNMGAFNTSKTQWDYDGLHHHEGVMRQLHDVSSAWTLYSEMAPRYAQAFAALKLFREREAAGNAPKGKEWSNAHEFALHQVNQSQFTWGDQARAFGKQGFGGGLAPLFGQFQGFRAALLEKMHREFADAFGARGPEYTSQARRFLLTHLAAQTVLAGSMGLPFVGMFAGVYDRLADWTTGNHTHDIRASYRGWLSNTFGNGVGEVLAHGVPRVAGIDLSSHLGEDRLLPLTDLATSKQKLEDEVRDQAFKLTGSSAHLFTNVLLGLRDMTNGDFLEGSTKVMPEALRNIAEGTLVAQHGYTDKAGFGLPGEKPSSMDVVAKMLGFTPSNEANYAEKERVAQGIRERSQYDVNNIQTHLAKSFNRQDPATYVKWLAASNQWMLAHPGQMPPAGTFGNYLTEHMRSAAVAGALHTPLGVNPRDFLTRGMVSYGNLGDK